MINEDIKRKLNLYYIYSALIGTWFASGVWLFFSRKYLNNSTFGIIDSITFGIGMFAEVPAGVLADKIGRRKTVILGITMMGIGYLIWGSAWNGWLIFLGILVYCIGGAFQSGADEAMMYDYLKFHQLEYLWPKVSSNRYLIARISYIVSVFIGGLLYSYYDRLPFLLRAITFFLMLIPLVKLKAVDQAESIYKEIQENNFLTTLKLGINNIFNKKIVWIVPVYIFIQGISYTVFTAGLLRPLLFEHSGLATVYHSRAISIALVITVASIFILKKFEDVAYTIKSIYLMSLLCILGFALNIGSSLIASLIGLTIIQVASYLLIPMLSVELNKTIDSQNRATAISTANFFENMIYVISAPIVGLLAEKGQIDALIQSVVVLLIVGLFASFVLFRLGRTFAD